MSILSVVTMSRCIGILVLWGVLMLLLFLACLKDIKQYGAAAVIVSYFIAVLLLFFATVLVWWAVSMIING